MVGSTSACLLETMVTSLPMVLIQTKSPKHEPAYASRSVFAVPLHVPPSMAGILEMLVIMAVCESILKPPQTLGRSPSGGQGPRTLNLT